VAESDAALGKVVGGKLHRDAVSGKHADAVAAQAARQVSQNDLFVFQLYTEQTTRKLLEHGTCYFDAIFFAQSNSFRSNC
jgi:hypothetical protein